MYKQKRETMRIHRCWREKKREGEDKEIKEVCEE
jgi:hypothetical protein